MLKTVGGIVLGYVAMAVAVFAGLTGAYVAMGSDRAFRPGLYDVSLVWVITSLVVGFGAALLGGWLARRLSGTARGPRLLAGLVVVLGVALAVAALLSEPAAAGIRTGEMGPFDAMQAARTPIWLMFLNPVVGAVGTLLGGRAIGTAEPTDPLGVVTA